MLAAAVTVPSGAQEPEPPTLQTQLAALNATMVRIAELLERQIEGQKIELVMARVTINLDRMQRTEDQLRAAETERTSLEDAKERLQLEQQSYFASLEAAKDLPIDELNRARDQFDASSKRLETKLRDANRRVADLQSQLVTQQAEVQEWQDFADRLLGGL
jgi:chromosome segregation ATPase